MMRTSGLEFRIAHAFGWRARVELWPLNNLLSL